MVFRYVLPLWFCIWWWLSSILLASFWAMSGLFQTSLCLSSPRGDPSVNILVGICYCIMSYELSFVYFIFFTCGLSICLVFMFSFLCSEVCLCACSLVFEVVICNMSQPLTFSCCASLSLRQASFLCVYVFVSMCTCKYSLGVSVSSLCLCSKTPSVMLSECC